MAKILVVDDEALVRQTLRDLLQFLGHEVFEAEHGHQAMALLAWTEVDLVITDLMMPVMDGIETIRALKAGFPEVAVVAMSGGSRTRSSLFDFLPMATSLGAAAMLPKPFTMAQLEATLNRYLPPPRGSSAAA